MCHPPQVEGSPPFPGAETSRKSGSGVIARISNTKEALRMLGERKDKEWGLKQQSPRQDLGEGDRGLRTEASIQAWFLSTSVRTTGRPPTRKGPEP